MPRLLICNTHKTVDVMNDYDTERDMEGRFDFDLKESIDRHLGRYGSDPGQHKSLIYRITPDEWKLIDVKRLQQAVFDNSLEEYIRGEREQLKDDALRCYQLHDRPTYGIGYGIGCPDYRSDNRRIGAETEEGSMYLCDFCPYQSYVEHEQNKQVKFRGEK